MNTNVIKVRKPTDIKALAEEIADLIRSGQVVGLEVFGVTSDLAALQVMNEAKEIFTDLGCKIEASPKFEEFQVLASPESEKKTGCVKWAITIKERNMT